MRKDIYLPWHSKTVRLKKYPGGQMQSNVPFKFVQVEFGYLQLSKHSSMSEKNKIDSYAK